MVLFRHGQSGLAAEFCFTIYLKVGLSPCFQSNDLSPSLKQTKLTALKSTVMHNCCFSSNCKKWITNIRGVFLYSEWVKPHPPSCTLLSCACIQVENISKNVYCVSACGCMCMRLIVSSGCIVLVLRLTKPLTSNPSRFRLLAHFTTAATEALFFL